MASDVLDRRWIVLAILTFAMFMVMLDATIVNVAMAERRTRRDAKSPGATSIARSTISSTTPWPP